MIFLPDISLDALMLWGLVGYLLGSIPSGVLIARVMGLGNLREIGSGNIGATNVLRTGNKTAAALTLLFDALKGVLAVLLARNVADNDAAQIAAIAALLGHCFPVWLKFKGGKGVATYFGVIVALAWPLGIVAAVLWLSVAAISRYSSMAALVVAGWLPILMMFSGYTSYFVMGVLLGLLVYFRHWGNIQRLRDGTEAKIGAKSVR